MTVLHSFSGGADGTQPLGSLTLSGSTLYGTTIGADTTGDYGTIFKISTDGTGYKVLHTFTGGDDGYGPMGLTLSGLTLYGMAAAGGVNGSGTIFKINADGTGFQVLRAFTGGNDGSGPFAALTLSGSMLYGTTYRGGAENHGTIFKINTNGTGYQVLYTFTGGDDGGWPEAELTLSGSTLYGTASVGGKGPGTIFKINTDGTGFKVLYTFSFAGGYNPLASLTLSGSSLYGTTYNGGQTSLGMGTIFKINTDGTGYKVLHTFNGGGADGTGPQASLTLTGSTLYGTCQQGGAGGCGTIFKINTDGTGYQVLYSFTGGAVGYGPYASLTLSGSTLYGTTARCGSDDDGTIFSFTTSTAGTLWQNAKDLGSGWKWLSWFGYFNTNSSPWIYHMQHGWLYAFGTSTDSIWFYDSTMGAFWWTSATVYPYVYRASDGAWLYYDVGTSNPRWFFNYSTNKWEKD